MLGNLSELQILKQVIAINLCLRLGLFLVLDEKPIDIIMFYVYERCPRLLRLICLTLLTKGLIVAQSARDQVFVGTYAIRFDLYQLIFVDGEQLRRVKLIPLLFSGAGLRLGGQIFISVGDVRGDRSRIRLISLPRGVACPPSMSGGGLAHQALHIQIAQQVLLLAMRRVLDGILDVDAVLNIPLLDLFAVDLVGMTAVLVLGAKKVLVAILILDVNFFVFVQQLVFRLVLLLLLVHLSIQRDCAQRSYR